MTYYSSIKLKTILIIYPLLVVLVVISHKGILDEGGANHRVREWVVKTESLRVFNHHQLDFVEHVIHGGFHEVHPELQAPQDLHDSLLLKLVEGHT